MTARLEFGVNLNNREPLIAPDYDVPMLLELAERVEEAGFDSVWVGDSLLAFDGRVLEVFGFPGSLSLRFHVRNMELSVDPPDRKGRYWVNIRATRGSGGCSFHVEPQDWPAAGPFFDRVFAAIPG